MGEMKHRACIVGAGRIGVGYNWPPHPFPYTHLDAYRALADRVEVVGICDPDRSRRTWIQERYSDPDFSGPALWESDERMLWKVKPDIVSLCTPPEARAGVLKTCKAVGVRGVWCEKPFATSGTRVLAYEYSVGLTLQVNYIRRFEPMHQRVVKDLLGGVWGKPLSLTVHAKADVHTVCHFTDLALWCRIPPERIHYVPTDGTAYMLTEYEIVCEKAKIEFTEGGAWLAIRKPGKSGIFPGAETPQLEHLEEWRPVFMTAALGNLLDALDGKAALISPPVHAMAAECWADTILGEGKP